MENEAELKIRPATLYDAERIFELIREHEEDLIMRSLGDIIQNIDRFIVCECEREVVGCGAWKILPEFGEPEKAAVEIQSVAVRKNLRRRKVGSLLIKEILRVIKRFQPAQAIVLTFAPEFFKALGFTEIPKTKVMHKMYMGCINCTKYTNPFTCPEIAMALNLRCNNTE